MRVHHKIILKRAGVLIEIKDLTFAEKGVPRGKCRFRKVEEMITGNDGEIRGVRVKVVEKGEVVVPDRSNSTKPVTT